MTGWRVIASRHFLNSTAGQVAAYPGGGQLPVFVTGNLLTSALDGYHNISDLGPDAPATSVNSPKVFSNFGLQLYGLQTTLVVTHFVPEAGTSAVGLPGLAAGWALWRRSRR